MVRRVSPAIIALAVASCLALGAGPASASHVSCGQFEAVNSRGFAAALTGRLSFIGEFLPELLNDQAKIWVLQKTAIDLALTADA